MTIADVRDARRPAVFPPRPFSQEPSAHTPDGAPQWPEPCEIALITDLAEFTALEEPWNALFARAGRPHQLFQTHDWLRHWARHYLGVHTRLSLVTAWQAGRLVMVWPLVTVQAAGLRRLCWMGEPVSQYGDVLVEDGPSRDDLLRHGWTTVTSLGADVIHLRKVRADGVAFALLRQAGALSIACAAAPYLDLASVPDYDTYQRRHPAKKRARRRRLLRSLQERGPVAFEHHGCGAAARELVTRAVAFKHTWLTERAIVAPALQDSRFGQFLGDVAGESGGTLGVRVCALRCDGEPAGVEVSLACKGHTFAYLISYDIGFARHGAGIIVAEHSIRTAHEHGLRRFDLLTPADPYKMEWADGSVEVRDWALPLSFAGRLYARTWLCFIHKWLKRAVHGSPQWLRRVVRKIL